MPPPPPAGHVHLILREQGNSTFYLEIPTNIIHNLCLKPLKYLLYLGWCILGVEGHLALQPGSEGIDIQGNLSDRTVYHYVPAHEDFGYVANLDVIKTKSVVPSQATEPHANFHNLLLARDSHCIWTGTPYADAMHIIPYARGSEWLQYIIRHCPHNGENIEDFTSINDIRNGMIAFDSIHRCWDLHVIVCLKTPNKILTMEDVPPRHERQVPNNPEYPTTVRYTLQWLIEPDPSLLPLMPNNADAAFNQLSNEPKPSGLLLHFVYGAAAVKWWGKNADILSQLGVAFHPCVPAPKPLGPPKTSHDRTVAIGKQDRARAAEEASCRGGPGGESTALGDAAGKPEETASNVSWDEEDVVLFFWANSPAARERRRNESAERAALIEEWRKNIV